MLKSDLVKLIIAEGRLRPRQAEQAVSALFDRLGDALVRGETVEIRGFGSFHVRSYDGYTGRDPRTSAAIDVAAKRGVQFRTGKELRDRINGAGTAATSAETDDGASETEGE